MSILTGSCKHASKYSPEASQHKDLFLGGASRPVTQDRTQYRTNVQRWVSPCSCILHADYCYSQARPVRRMSHEEIAYATHAGKTVASKPAHMHMQRTPQQLAVCCMGHSPAWIPCCETSAFPTRSLCDVLLAVSWMLKPFQSSLHP